MTTDRSTREAAVAAELELDSMILKARRINRAIIVTLLVIGALLVGFNWPKPADAAKRNVYRGTVTICYAPSTKAPKIDQYLYTQWDLVAAAKAAGVGSVRVVKERYPHTTCFGDVSVWSSPEPYYNNATRPYYVYTYGEAGQMWYSQVTMGDKVGAKATAAQRQAWLVAALKVAIPR